MPKIALISVSDKTGIVEFVKQLISLEFKIISTGGTAKLLQENEIPVTQVSDFTRYPEMMDGRVKTLNPLIHGGILADRDNPKHQEDAQNNNVNWIDLVVVNLYPFEETLQNPNSSFQDKIENIDIGGPTLLRAAAKNHQHVTVISNPEQYSRVAEELQNTGNTSLETRQLLAAETFASVRHYDQIIDTFFQDLIKNPKQLHLHYEKVQDLRYGENPHQQATFFRDPQNKEPNITNAKVLGGKELSFNNIVDANSAIELVKEFDRPTVVFIKHNNPCGVASSDTMEQAFQLSHQVDSLSAFGGVVAMNGKCTDEIVDYIEENKLFLEIIICTQFEGNSLERLQKKPNLRLLELGELTPALNNPDNSQNDIKKVAGGILIQSADNAVLTPENLKVVTEKSPSQEEIQAMLFAGKIVKHVKSNAIIFAKVDEFGNEIVTGIGAGQMSRVDSVYIARHKGGDKIPGSVMASDAFFPFPDGIEEAHKAQAVAVLQPGGSIKDDEVIKRANELSLSMVFTGIRSFRH